MYKTYKSQKVNSKYVNLEINGKLFPSWILKNFKHYHLPKIILAPGSDPCKNITENLKNQKKELRKYQQFVGEYLNNESPYNSILVYHGLGTGKSATAINVYNILYNASPKWNLFILLKTSLKESWLAEIKTFIDNNEMQNNIYIIGYDSPNSYNQYIEKKKMANPVYNSLYIIEEAHNFINSVYSNVKQGIFKNAVSLYDAILQDKKEKPETRVVLLSGTPMINKPFELSLLFNLLRPDTFPTNEEEFNKLFVNSEEHMGLNKSMKNLFQRRILGLVSYYYGSTPDYFAESKYYSVNAEMSTYQYEKYLKAQKLEDEITLNMLKKNKKSSLFRTYTRQATNFVFPNNIERPRPSDFKLTELEIIENTGDERKKKEYQNKINKYILDFKKLLNEQDLLDKKNNHTIDNDIESYINSNITYEEFNKDLKKKSLVYNLLYNCSTKYVCAALTILRNPGTGLVYANYVKVEGLEMFKIYLSYFNFGTNKKYNYVEFHSEVGDIKQRYEGMKLFNNINNIDGSKYKLILISAAGTEGLNLKNTRHVHILDPYWNETRIIQVIGRAIRLCSHVDLPIKDRKVNIYRYHSIYKKSNKKLVDHSIECVAKKKHEIENSFLEAIKEAAIDCALYKNHNMLTINYNCFQFNENSLFDKYIGPAYRKDINQDIDFENGLNSNKYQVLTIKVKKIKAVKILSIDPIKYSVPEDYLYNKKTNVVYDIDLHFAIGKIAIKNNIPEFFKDNIYIIDKVIPIPTISQ